MSNCYCNKLLYVKSVLCTVKSTLCKIVRGIIPKDVIAEVEYILYIIFVYCVDKHTCMKFRYLK